MKNFVMLFFCLASGSAVAFNALTEQRVKAIQAESKTAEYFAEKGMQNADLFPGLANLCDIESPIRDLSNRKRSNNANQSRGKNTGDKSRSNVTPATQVFDNLYFVGTRGVSSWVLKTSEGLILIDALNTNRQAKDYIEKGMVELGLDIKDIKYLIIGHEHGDHYGGQEYIVQKSNARVVMGDVAWSRMENNELTVFSPRWGAMPKRDISAHDGDKITLGDIEVQIYETPGHTPGTISLIFPVYDQGKKHLVSLWGGTGLNYGPDKTRIQSYTNAATRFGEIAKAQGVDVFLSNHPRRDGSAEKFMQMHGRDKSAPHPFVQGQDAVAKAYEMLASCTQAQVLKIENYEKQ